MSVQEEARRLHDLFASRPADLIGHLGHQLSTVKTYAQVLVGLCGLTITVTGFSGAHMIRAGSLSAWLMAGDRNAAALAARMPFSESSMATASAASTASACNVAR